MIRSVIGSGGKIGELARIDWSGMKQNLNHKVIPSSDLVTIYSCHLQLSHNNSSAEKASKDIRTVNTAKAHKAKMQSSEDADDLGEMSALTSTGQDYSFKVVDVLKPGGVIETEVEVLGFRSSALPSQALRKSC